MAAAAVAPAVVLALRGPGLASGAPIPTAAAHLRSLQVGVGFACMFCGLVIVIVRRQLDDRRVRWHHLLDSSDHRHTDLAVGPGHWSGRAELARGTGIPA